MSGANQELQRLLKKLDDNLHGLLKQAFVQVNLYYVFQGIVLTAVSSSSPNCHRWPFFAIVSIVPFLLNVVPLIYTMCKYVETNNERDRYKLVKERNRSIRGSNGSGQIGDDGTPRDDFWGSIRYVGVVICALVLVGFNGVILYGCHSLLCENVGTDVEYEDGSCFRLCDFGDKCLKICTN